MGVTVEKRGEIAIVTITNPPVNAIGAAERLGLLKAVMEMQRSPLIRGRRLAAAWN